MRITYYGSDSCIIWQEFLPVHWIEVGAGKREVAESSACAGEAKDRSMAISLHRPEDFSSEKYITKDRWSDET